MKKRVVIFVFVCLMLFGTTATSFASNMDFSFNMTPGGTSDYSSATYKSDGENAWYVTPKYYLNGTYSDWAYGETLRFRARFDSDRSAASSLYSRNVPNLNTTFHYGYTDSTPTYGINYRLYADKPAGQEFGTCILVGTWCP